MVLLRLGLTNKYYSVIMNSSQGLNLIYNYKFRCWNRGCSKSIILSGAD